MFRVDPPPATPPAITLNGQAGVLIYQDWLISDKVTAIRPGNQLVWPTTVTSNGTAELVAPTTSEPLAPKVEVRLFSKPIPASGIPDEDPTVLKCRSADQSPEPPAGSTYAAACTLWKAPDGMHWDITRIPSTTTALIFNVSWYIPERIRMTVPKSGPVDTVAVGWKILTHH